MLKGTFSFSLMALCVKALADHLPAMEVVFFRSFFGMLIILFLMQKKKVSVWGLEKKILSLRGLSGFIALSLHFYTIQNLPLGTAVMLNYTSPIFSVLFAIFFLKEKASPLLYGMVALSFFGVYLLVGSQLEGEFFLVTVGLASAVFASIAYTLIRVIKQKESPLTIIFYFTFISSVGSFPFALKSFVFPGLFDWILLIGIAVTSYFGQVFMTIALRRAPAVLVSVFSYTTPLLSFVYGFVFFGEVVTLLAMIGVLLIITGGSLVSYFETKLNRPRL